MALSRKTKEEMRTIVFLDAVNFTLELKTHGRALIIPKINQLREFTEFFFVHKLKGEFIGQLGDGFLVLCPPTPIEVINEAIACQSFIMAYNHGKETPAILNTRIAIHYGLIAPPEGGNYIDTNLNFTARLEGVTPPNGICISSVLYDIVVDVLRGYKFEELKSDFKGLGQNKYYIISNPSVKTPEPTRREARLSFYFSTIDALREVENWEAVRDTCEQALVDFHGHPEFTSQLAYASLILGDNLGAIRTYEQCIQMGYDVADSLYFIGVANRDIGNEARAIEIFEEAIKKEPKIFHAMVELGEIYLNRRDYVEANHWAKKVTKLAPIYYIPYAIQVVIALVLKKDKSLNTLIKKIPPQVRMRGDFRLKIEDYLKSLSETDYSKKLRRAFKAAGKHVASK